MENYSYNKFIGGLFGIAIGDSLGAYSKSRNKSTQIIPDSGASITIVTEITIQLLKSILKNRAYDEDIVIVKYLKCVNKRNCIVDNKNIRALMKGIVTLRSFKKRQESIPISQIESNISLLRCFPLVLLKRWNSSSNKNVSLTNDNKISRECSRIYLSIANYFIFGKEIKVIIKQQRVIEAIRTSLNNNTFNLREKEDGVVHGLYVSLVTLFNTTSYHSGIGFINKHCSRENINTLLPIAGALLGSYYGFESIFKEQATHVNIHKINDWMRKTNRCKFDDNMYNSIKNFIRLKNNNNVDGSLMNLRNKLLQLVFPDRYISFNNEFGNPIFGIVPRDLWNNIIIHLDYISYLRLCLVNKSTHRNEPMSEIDIIEMLKYRCGNNTFVLIDKTIKTQISYLRYNKIIHEYHKFVTNLFYCNFPKSNVPLWVNYDFFSKEYIQKYYERTAQELLSQTVDVYFFDRKTILSRGGSYYLNFSQELISPYTAKSKQKNYIARGEKYNAYDLYWTGIYICLIQEILDFPDCLVFFFLGELLLVGDTKNLNFNKNDEKENMSEGRITDESTDESDIFYFDTSESD